MNAHFNPCDPAAQVGAIGLVYVSDSEPGIRRIRRGRGFSYHLSDGGLLREAAELQRIKSLGLPPAYESVWICTRANGHLQATGLDARGRKQYRYHADWQTFRTHNKFEQLAAFGNALPRLRRRVLRDLEGDATEERTVLAALCMLLDRAHLRVGNRAYAEENGSYGATTLLKRHLRLKGDRLELDFTGKGGKRVRRRLRHPRLSRVLEQISDLPGRQLFAWRDGDDQLRPVDSGRLNAYLSEVTELDVTAKTFRTWAGSVAAYDVAHEAICEGGRPTIRAMAEASAEVLSNTPAISRSSYIHPAVIALSEDALPASAKWFARQDQTRAGLRAAEGRALRFLERFSGETWTSSGI
ncbi:DNA topoisomerase IB [Stappia sp. BW2]|uniref:DNA topoisomerase IB n=1 Tax=Stappia sp. BW2 TaxID=2592622 RepID=UPI0011DEA34E|nr:DNA topoisomerase IB [Stappia sp. BW2]TYC70079.1 DNA topoisomerase IB [Stappia sp. BW2]